jgi:micrococcal nuclease
VRLAFILATSLLSGGALAASLHISDGDTFTLDGERIRIENIDAPELFSPKCESERRPGDRRQARAGKLLAAGPIVLVRAARLDRHGRTIAKVRVNGKDVGEALIAAQVARAWRGKREPWC